MLELGGLQLEESLLGGGVRELEGVEVAAGVRALLRVELCDGFFFGWVEIVSKTRNTSSARDSSRDRTREQGPTDVTRRGKQTTRKEHLPRVPEDAFGDVPAERFTSAKPMASTSMSTRVFRGTLMLKPRYEGCSLSTLPASTQEMPVDCSAKITPTRPSMAQRECWSSHSRKRTMSNASLKGCADRDGRW